MCVYFKHDINLFHIVCCMWYCQSFYTYYESVNRVIYMAAKVSLKSIFCPMTFYFTFDLNRGCTNAVMWFLLNANYLQIKRYDKNVLTLTRVDKKCYQEYI